MFHPEHYINTLLQKADNHLQVDTTQGPKRDKTSAHLLRISNLVTNLVLQLQDREIFARPPPLPVILGWRSG
jgi:hypothetical protein